MSRIAGRFVGIGLGLSAAAFVATPAMAWPSISLNWQTLSISRDECLHRAERAFESNGWGNVTVKSFFARAHKDSFSGYVVCNLAADGRGVDVEVFMANDGGNDPDAAVVIGEGKRLLEQLAQGG